MSGTVPDDPPPVTPPEPDAAAPPKPAEPPKAPVEPPVAGAPPKAPEPPKQPDPPARHPFDEDDDPPTDDIAPQYTKIREGFEKLRGKLRKAREDGNFGKLIQGAADRGKLTKEALAKWVDIGARLNVDDPAAIAEFQAMAQRMGLIPPPAAAPPAPAAPPPVDAKALADQIYAEDYAEDVKTFQISEEVARAKATKVANRLALSRSPQTSPPPAPAPTQLPAPQQPMQSPLHQEALQAVNRMEAELAAKIPDWGTKLQPLVLAEIKARRARDGGISPVYWVSDFTDAVNKVRAQLAPPAAPPPVKVEQTLAPSRQPAKPGTTAPTWDGEGGLREQTARALMGGGAGLDNLLESLPVGR